MTLFKINKNYSVVCESESTRSGFRHVAVLLLHGHEILRDKVCYQNRTWERYTFETVIRNLLDKRIKKLEYDLKMWKSGEKNYPQDYVEECIKEIEKEIKALSKPVKNN